MIDSRQLNNRMVTGDSLRDRDGDERFVEPTELAAYWGVHVQTVYRDLRKGALPHLRLPGGRLRIRWSDARRYGRPNE
jgi:excisionase family DNA binding protein